jgi:hypothetical protein
MDIPEVRYAKTDDGVKLAYQVIGARPIDIVYVPGCESNIELNWDNPRLARCLRRLASFSRLIVLALHNHLGQSACPTPSLLGYLLARR